MFVFAKKLSLLGSVTSAALAVAYPAHAQQFPGTAAPNVQPPASTPVPPKATTSAPQAETALGEIVVTARKKTELQRDVPVSIQTVGGAQLAQAKITQIIDLQARVPTLEISTGLTQPFVGIRGFGSGNSQSFDQAVGKFIDNVSYGRDQDARIPLFDIERVEVLKGPQVLLYGNSTTAGALNITTRKPGRTFEADGSTSYEFYDREVVTQGGVTAPLTDWASLRVSGIYQNLARGDDYNSATGKHIPTTKNYAGRAILDLKPAAGLDIVFKAEFDHLRTLGAVGEPVAQPTSGAFMFPEVNLDGHVASNNDVAPFFAKNYVGINNQTYQMDINYDLLGGTLTSTTAYRDEKVSLSASGGQQIPIFNGLIFYDEKQFSQETRYSVKLGRFDLTAGAFYQHENRNSITVADFNFAAAGVPLPPVALNLTSPQKTDSYSGFADLTYHLTDRLSLEFGARYSEIDKTGAQSAALGDVVPGKTFGSGANIIAPDPLLAPLYPILFGVPAHSFTDLRLHENFFQPQAIVQYKFADKNQVYFKYVKGDKAGGFDVAFQGAPGNVTPQAATFQPEKASSYELGVKGLILDNRLEYALAAYREDFTNLQTNAYVGQATVAVVANVGKARSQGFEAELHYSVAPGLKLNVSGAYTDAKYVDFPGGSCTRAQAAAQPIGCVQDLSGTRTPYSSRWAGTVGLDYERPVGEYTLAGGVILVGRSKFNVTTNNEPLLEQQGFVQLDGHIDLKPTTGWWSFSVFMRNLTDKRVLEYGSIAPGTSGGLLAFRSRGRQIGLTAGFHF